MRRDRYVIKREREKKKNGKIFMSMAKLSSSFFFARVVFGILTRRPSRCATFPPLFFKLSRHGSMFPLLVRDGLLVPYAVTQLVLVGLVASPYLPPTPDAEKLYEETRGWPFGGAKVPPEIHRIRREAKEEVRSQIAGVKESSPPLHLASSLVTVECSPH